MASSDVEEPDLPEEAGHLFEYPLLTGCREIRLIRPMRGNDKHWMRCEFIHVSLDNLEMPYIAISYTWGSPEAVDRIWCNDGEYLNLTHSAGLILRSLLDDQTLKTSELGRTQRFSYSATSILRYPFNMQIRIERQETMWIWIDSLCINQRDNDEKANQVHMMRDIYSSALHVTAWLGDPSPESNLALAFVPELHSAIATLLVGDKSQLTVSFEALTRLPSCEYPSAKWSALSHFLDRPYFRRVWIIQEIVQASKITLICGDQRIDWEPLVIPLMVLKSSGLARLLAVHDEMSSRNIGTPAVRYINRLRMARISGNLLSLQDALIYSRQFQASNPRDRIYALIGICDCTGFPAIGIDYTASVEVVYNTWMRQLLLTQQSLQLLHEAGIGFPRKLHGLPSWVPDWTSLPDSIREPLGFAELAAYRAAGDTTAEIQVTPSQSTITIAGHVVDTVRFISPPRPKVINTSEPDRYKQNLTEIMVWIQITLSVMPYRGLYIGGGTWEEAHWRTLIANITDTGVAVAPNFRDYFDTFLAHLRIVYEAESIDEAYKQSIVEEQPNNGYPYASAFANSSHYRFFQTARGYIGLAPMDTIEGDLVCILRGAVTPFILRQSAVVGDGNDGKRLVGECYVHGLMNGEALSMVAREHILIY